MNPPCESAGCLMQQGLYGRLELGVCAVGFRGLVQLAHRAGQAGGAHEAATGLEPVQLRKRIEEE